jgi:hypothetical protein
MTWRLAEGACSRASERGAARKGGSGAGVVGLGDGLERLIELVRDGGALLRGGPNYGVETGFADGEDGKLGDEMPETVGWLDAIASAFASGGYGVRLGGGSAGFPGAAGERFGEIDEGAGICVYGTRVGIWTS